MLIAFAVCFQAGCAAPLHDDALPPPEAAHTWQATHRLEVETPEGRYVLLAVWDGSPAAVTLIGLDELANRLFTVALEPEQTRSRWDSPFPQQLPLAPLVQSLQLALWPAVAWHGAEGRMLRCVDDEHRRFEQDGKLIAEVRYGPGRGTWDRSFEVNLAQMPLRVAGSSVAPPAREHFRAGWSTPCSTP